jgi:hypothetical protein
MNRSLSYFFLLLCIGCVSACSEENTGPTATSFEALNASIGCLNATANPVVISNNQYLSTRVSLEQGLCENAVITPLPKEALSLCATAVEKSLFVGDEMAEIHGNTKAVHESYLLLSEALEKTHLHYLGQDYLDDKCINALMLKKELSWRFDDYFTAEKALRAFIHSSRPDGNAAFLEQIRQRDAEGTEWHIRRILHAAEELVRDADPSQEKRLAKFRQLDTAVSALELYLKEHGNALAKAKGENWWSQTRILHAKAKAWSREIRAGNEIRPTSLVEPYNAMLANTNLLAL